MVLHQMIMVIHNKRYVGLTVKIDLTNSTFRRCLKPHSPGDMGSDYELLNLSSHECINGHSRQYLIRKPDAHCLISDDVNTSLIINPCSCTPQDY